MKDAIVLDDGFQVAGRGCQFFEDTYNLWMAAVARADTLDLALSFLQVS